MVRLITALTLLITAYSGTSQVLDTTFNGYLSPLVITGGSAPTWTFNSRFINANKTFTGAEVGTDCKIIVYSGGQCYQLTLNSVAYSGGNISGSITDPSGSLTTLPSIGAIVRPTDNRGLLPYVSGVPPNFQSCIEVYNNSILDTIATSAISNVDSFVFATVWSLGDSLSNIRTEIAASTSNVTDTTITASSYTADLSSIQESRILTDVTSNNITVVLPSVDKALLGKTITVNQINSTNYKTIITVSGGGTAILPPGATAATDTLIIPAGSQGQYNFILGFNKTVGTYLWTVIGINQVFPEVDGLKAFDPITESKQLLSYEYTYDSIPIGISAAPGSWIRVGTQRYKVVESTSYTVDSICVFPVSNGFAVNQSKELRVSELGITSNVADTLNNAEKLNKIGIFAQEARATVIMDLDTIPVLLGDSSFVMDVRNGKKLFISSPNEAVIDVYPKFVTGLPGDSHFFGSSENSVNYYRELYADNLVFIMADSIDRAFATRRYGVLRGSNGGGHYEFHNVEQYGEANLVLYWTGGGSPRWLVVRDCRFEAWVGSPNEGIIVGLFGGRDYYHFHSYNTDYHGASSHQLYIAPWTNLYMEGGRAAIGYTSTDNWLQANQTLPPDPVIGAKYQIIRNVIFEGQGSINQDRSADYLPHLIVEGCIFYETTASSPVKDKVTWRNNTFIDGGGVRLSPDTSAAYVISGVQGKADAGSMFAGTAKKRVAVVSTGNTVDRGPNTNMKHTDSTRYDMIITNTVFKLPPATVGNPVGMFYPGGTTGGIGGPVGWKGAVANCIIDGSLLQTYAPGPVQWLFKDNDLIYAQRIYANYNTTCTNLYPYHYVRIQNLRGKIFNSGYNYINGYFVDDRCDVLGDTIFRIEWHFCDEKFNGDTLTVASDGIPDSINMGANYYIMNVPSDSLVQIRPYNEEGAPVWASSPGTLSGDRDPRKYIAGYFDIHFVSNATLKAGYTLDIDEDIKVYAGDTYRFTVDLHATHAGQDTSWLKVHLVEAGETTRNRMIANIATANLIANASYTTDWDTHTITFDFSAHELDSMAFRMLSPSGKTYGEYVNDTDGYIYAIRQGLYAPAQLGNPAIAPLVVHNNEDNIDVGNVGDSLTIKADKLFIDIQNPEVDSTLKSVLTLDGNGQVVNTSFSQARAEIYVDYLDPDTVTVVNAGTLYDLTDATENVAINFTANSAGRLTYLGTKTIDVQIIWTATVTSNGTNENLIGTILDNGATLTRIRWEQEDVASGDRYSVSAHGTFTMSTNDWIQPKFTAESNGTVIEVINTTFSAEEKH